MTTTRIGETSLAHILPIDALIAFANIADSGSINKAAIDLNTSQPTLTRAIQQLENIVGGQLFHRSSKSVSLTSLGATLLDQARAVRCEAIKAQQMIDHIRQQRESEFHVGLVPAQHPLQLLTKAIVDFTTTYPRLTVHLHTGSVPELLEKLREGFVEVVVGPLIGEHDTRSVVAEHLYDDVTELCCRAGHPLAKKALTIDDLNNAEWVLGPVGSPSREHLSHIVTDHAGTAPKVKIEVENVLIRLNLVRRSNLLSVFDLHHVTDDIQRNTLIKLRFVWQQQRRPMGILRTAHPSQLSRKFVSDLAEILVQARWELIASRSPFRVASCRCRPQVREVDIQAMSAGVCDYSVVAIVQ